MSGTTLSEAFFVYQYLLSSSRQQSLSTLVYSLEKIWGQDVLQSQSAAACRREGIRGESLRRQGLT
jgi:hypothetical protein